MKYIAYKGYNVDIERGITMDRKVTLQEKADLKLDEELVEYMYRDVVQKINSKVKATKGRKRPRNPQERETLLRWERERGGIKIGEI